MKTLILISLVLSMPLSAQIKITYALWNDKITDKQVIFWDNDNIRHENVIDSNNVMLRKEYSKEGELKKTCEIKQKYIVDTVYILERNTGKMVTDIQRGYIDIPNGKYIEYYPGTNIARLEGTLMDKNKTGVWTQRDQNGNVLFSKDYTEK